MDGTSQFLNYNLQDGDSGNYQSFDGVVSAGQQSYPQGFAAAAFLDEAPSHPQLPPPPAPAPAPAPPAKVMQPPPRMQSSLPARAAAQLRTSPFGPTPGIPQQDSLLSIARASAMRLDSPGLSTGSTTTPETRASGQNITPTDVPSITSQPSKAPEAIFPPPPPTPPARKRRPRRPRPKSEASPEEEEEKRNKFLERNRAAASKCRQKKKEWTSDLEQTKIDLETRNAQLRMEFNGLQGEVSRARALLMTHASCHDINIDKWLENEAKRYVLGTGEQYDTMLAVNFGFAAGPPPQLRHESLSTISGYTTAGTNDILSPTGRQDSISLPRGIAISDAAVFLQAQVPGSSAAAHIEPPGPSYILSHNMKIGDVSDPKNFDMSNNML